MVTTMTKEMAVSAVREICTRPWRGANTAHAGTFRSEQGRTVPFAGLGDDTRFMGVRTAGVDASTPITGVVYPRLEAPPV